MTTLRSKTRRVTRAFAPAVALALALATQAVPAAGDEKPTFSESLELWNQALNNEYFKVSFNARTRMELANFDTFHSSQAYTTRVLLGVGNKPIHGFSGYVELESSWSYDNDGYFDVVTIPNRRMQTPIADPPDTALNQGYLKYENADLLGASAVVGRQRIIFDDARFVGNVGWRQNEQTYDAAMGSTSLGLEGLKASYAYVRDVHRIFGNQGPPANRDWDSDSHLVNVSFAGFAPLKVTAFAYLLDFRDDAPAASSNSYGVRAEGSTALGEKWKVSYAGSYAWQEDAGRNPVDYGTSYVFGDASVGFSPVGTLGGGYELLGSDHGSAVFLTPLATLHAFNGFADVFLNNGGPNGLQDAYAYVAPSLPWKLGGKFIYHHFWSDEGGTELGQEYDFVITRPITPWLSVLTKGAFFDSKVATLADGWRYWLEFTIKY